MSFRVWDGSEGQAFVILVAGFARFHFTRRRVVLSDRGRSKGLFSVNDGVGIVVG